MTFEKIDLLFLTLTLFHVAVAVGMIVVHLAGYQYVLF